MDYSNRFANKTDEELKVLYTQFLEFEKTGVIPDNELGKIRDEYCEAYSSNGILAMERDLLHTIADKWIRIKR